VPNFVKTTSNGKTKEMAKESQHAGPKLSTAVPPSRYHHQQQNPMALSNGHLAAAVHYHHHTQPAMWHTRSYDSGMGETFIRFFLFLRPRDRRVTGNAKGAGDSNGVSTS